MIIEVIASKDEKDVNQQKAPEKKKEPKNNSSFNSVLFENRPASRPKPKCLDLDSSAPDKTPTITSMPTEVNIGQSAEIQGQNYSYVYADNSIWFEGGVSTTPSNVILSNPNIMDFIVPAGAVSTKASLQDSSANFFVTVNGDLTSIAPSNEIAVLLQNSSDATFSSFRTVGYNDTTGDYWVAASWNGNNGFYQLKYDTTPNSPTYGTWTKGNFSGAYSGNTLYCSTHTDRFGKIFCGNAGAQTSHASTRVGRTGNNPPDQLYNCIDLGISSDSGDSVKVIGAAADPNPLGTTERDVIYFAFANLSNQKYYIKQVDANPECGSVLNQDYGGTGGTVFTWNGGIMAGMAVDLDGNLWVADTNRIIMIDTNQNVSPPITGFTRLMGLDIYQEQAGGTVYVLVADLPQGLPGDAKAIASDNVNADPLDLMQYSNLKTVAWSRDIFTGNWADMTRNRHTWVYNRANSAISIKGDYRLVVNPISIADGRVFTLVPENYLCHGPFQSTTRRPSSPSDIFSEIEVTAYWRDGLSRFLCGYTGDPLSTAAYDKPARHPLYCNIPIELAPMCESQNNLYNSQSPCLCDNNELFDTHGQGSISENNAYHYCSTCGESSSNPCTFHVRISKNYAGDNYQMYFKQTEDPNGIIAQATGNITAWKHAHLEKDKMCRAGGIIGLDALGGQTCIYLSKAEDQYLNWCRADNIKDNDQIAIFDSRYTLETCSYDTAYAIITNLDFVDDSFRHYVEICLKDSPEGSDYHLINDYLASEMEFGGENSRWYWTFMHDDGRSAGVCVIKDAITQQNPGYFEACADDFRQTFNDAFTTIEVPPPQFAAPDPGHSIVPYLDPEFYNDYHQYHSEFNFQQYWFAHRTQEPPSDLNDKTNIWHLIGSSDDPINAGITMEGSNASFILVKTLENDCNQNDEACKLALRKEASAHEIVHQFDINPDMSYCKGHDWCSLYPDPDPNYLCDHREYNDAWCGTSQSPGSCVKSPYTETKCMLSFPASDPQALNEFRRLECEDLAGYGGQNKFSCPSQISGSCGGMGIRNQQDPM